MTTEREMLDRLAVKYGPGKGYRPQQNRWARAEHVRNDAGWDAYRTIDFIAMDTNKGLALHGHEVKVSRADWLTELRDPTKAEAFRPYMDYWWLVVSDKNIVRDDLPEGWGLMAPRGDSLVVIQRAPRNYATQIMPKGMLAALLRSTIKTTKRELAA